MLSAFNRHNPKSNHNHRSNSDRNNNNNNSNSGNNHRLTIAEGSSNNKGNIMEDVDQESQETAGPPAGTWAATATEDHHHLPLMALPAVSCSGLDGSSVGVGFGIGGVGGAGGGAPCGACKFLRRKCVSGCIFAPYFAAEHGATRFAAVHKIFGASNVSKLLQRIPVHKRLEAVITISYEAQARISNPVYGCVTTIAELQKKVFDLQNELTIVQAQLANSRQLAAMSCMAAIQQQQQHNHNATLHHQQHNNHQNISFEHSPPMEPIPIQHFMNNQCIRSTKDDVSEVHRFDAIPLYDISSITSSSSPPSALIPNQTNISITTSTTPTPIFSTHHLLTLGTFHLQQQETQSDHSNINDNENVHSSANAHNLHSLLRTQCFHPNEDLN